MVALAFNWLTSIETQQFEDVPFNNTFHAYIGQLYIRGVITGYPCGGPGEPCGQGNLPYFRPGNNVTRGQIAKIVQLARTVPTATPTSTLTPLFTNTPTSSTSTPTPIVTATQTPTNPDCQGIPESPYVQFYSSNCQPAGASFGLLAYGFQPNETVSIYITTPDGSIFGAPFQVQADPNGYTEQISFNTSSSMPLGQWYMTFLGLTSQYQAIGYFRLLAP